MVILEIPCYRDSNVIFYHELPKINNYMSCFWSKEQKIEKIG